MTIVGSGSAATASAEVRGRRCILAYLPPNSTAEVSRDARRHDVLIGVLNLPRSSLARLAAVVAACLSTLTSAHGAGAADLRNFVFVPSMDAPEVTMIDTGTDTVARRIVVGAPPRQLAVSASLDLLLTTNPDQRAISVADLDKATPAEQITIDLLPEHMQLDPTGQLLAIGNYAGGSILLVDLAARKVTARIDGFQGPHHLAFAPDGRRLYVGNLGADRVSVVDVASARIVREIALGDSTPATDTTASGGIRAITVSVDGRLGFVTLGNGDGLAIVDLAEQRLIKRLPLGDLSRRAYATADNRRLLVPNDGDDSVSIVDTATLREVARVPGARVMSGIATGWFETTAFVFARSEREVKVIDLDKAAGAGDIALPGRPEGGATTADGRKLYVALSDQNRVAVIDARTRRLVSVIDAVGHYPWSAVVVGTSNFCH